MAADDLVRMVPILAVGEVAPVVAFYERFGLRVTADHGDYVILATDPEAVDAVEVHLTLVVDHDPRTTDNAVYLRAVDAGALWVRLHQELEADGSLFEAPASGVTGELTASLRAREDAGEVLIRLHAVEDKPWGMRQFAVIDPAGTLVQVGSPLAP